MATEAQKKAVAKYDKANTRKITVKLNRNTDADILAEIEAGNMQGRIKELLRAGMEAQKRP